ncbi:uncharacterized protein [Amphiura filiformis]|uniref:uncharacterized protein n=1 Tax=Amphiura filiformis TaxID=82378 RepID=UPI003B221B9B
MLTIFINLVLLWIYLCSNMYVEADTSMPVLICPPPQKRSRTRPKNCTIPYFVNHVNTATVVTTIHGEKHTGSLVSTEAEGNFGAISFSCAEGTFTLIATDSSGNELESCTFNVTFDDDTCKHVTAITCPEMDNQIQHVSSCHDSMITEELEIQNATLNPINVTFDQIVQNIQPFSIRCGTTLLNYTVLDACGMSYRCTVNFTVTAASPESTTETINKVLVTTKAAETPKAVTATQISRLMTNDNSTILTTSLVTDTEATETSKEATTSKSSQPTTNETRSFSTTSLETAWVTTHATETPMATTETENSRPMTKDMPTVSTTSLETLWITTEATEMTKGTATFQNSQPKTNETPTVSTTSLETAWVTTQATEMPMATTETENSRPMTNDDPMVSTTSLETLWITTEATETPKAATASQISQPTPSENPTVTTTSLETVWITTVATETPMATSETQNSRHATNYNPMISTTSLETLRISTEATETPTAATASTISRLTTSENPTVSTIFLQTFITTDATETPNATTASQISRPTTSENPTVSTISMKTVWTATETTLETTRKKTLLFPGLVCAVTILVILMVIVIYFGIIHLFARRKNLAHHDGNRDQHQQIIHNNLASEPRVPVNFVPLPSLHITGRLQTIAYISENHCFNTTTYQYSV